VRCERTRNRKSGEEYLWEKMADQPVCGIQGVHIPRRGCQLAREARLEVRHAQVELKPPSGKDYPPVTVWMVYAREVDYPQAVASPLEWMLLTTVEVSTLEQACERLSWYARRWGIEVYHRTLKSGCRIEDRQLETAESLEACLALDMVVAWRIYHLTMLGREVPNLPCTIFFEEAEWKALYILVNQTTDLPATEPTLREAVRMVASLGGFLGRKGDGEPGTDDTLARTPTPRIRSCRLSPPAPPTQKRTIATGSWVGNCQLAKGGWGDFILRGDLRGHDG
jgi:hypothetical protein